MRAPITDEQLIAFLHGELDQSEYASIEAAINADQHLAERAEMLAAQDNDVRDAFAPILGAPVPEHLRAIVEQGPASNVVDFAAAKARRIPGNWSWPQFGAIAASLALGLFGGQSLVKGPEAPREAALVLASANGLQVSGDFADVLSRTASGKAVKVANLGEVNVAITFKTNDDRLCRQFSLRGSTQVDDAVACRSGKQWTLEAFGRRDEAPGEIRTASGEAAQPIIVAVDALIAGDPLTGDAEQQALRRQ